MLKSLGFISGLSILLLTHGFQALNLRQEKDTWDLEDAGISERQDQVSGWGLCHLPWSHVRSSGQEDAGVLDIVRCCVRTPSVMADTQCSRATSPGCHHLSSSEIGCVLELFMLLKVACLPQARSSLCVKVLSLGRGFY